MGRSARVWLAIGVLATVSCLALSEIHRAKALNTRPKPHHHSQYQYPLAPCGRSPFFPCASDEFNSTTAWLHDVVWGHTIQTWMFSIFSAFLVGLSGIFPLMVIPIEAGRSLRSGVANGRLKLLLSFAVGGLLGDIFLHLLPEAWAHLQRLGGDHKGHMQVGLWLMTGLLSFFMIQKVFPEEAEDEEEEAAEDQIIYAVREKENDLKCQQNGIHSNGLHKFQKEVQVNNREEVLSSSNGMIKPEKGRNGMKENEINMNGFTKNGDKRKELIAVGRKMQNNQEFDVKKPVKIRTDENHNRHLCLSDQQNNSLFSSLKSWLLGPDVQPDNSQSVHIKTSGWLNLMANMIDNFTHGLAVAGSYSVSTKTGLLTTIAILLHEVPHEIGDFAILLRAGFDRWKAAKAQLLTATGGMIGALLALAAESTKQAGDSTAWILPFTAGGFLYIALVTIVPDLQKEVNPWNSLKQLLCLCCGIGTMAMVTVLVE